MILSNTYLQTKLKDKNNKRDTRNASECITGLFHKEL